MRWASSVRPSAARHRLVGLKKPRSSASQAVRTEASNAYTRYVSTSAPRPSVRTLHRFFASARTSRACVPWRASSPLRQRENSRTM